jgi:hypothetical protein
LKKGRKMIKMSELEEQAKIELTEEKRTLGKEVIKERLREISDCKKALVKMEKQYEDLLTKDIEEIEDDDNSC